LEIGFATIRAIRNSVVIMLGLPCERARRRRAGSLDPAGWRGLKTPRYVPY
jgi:hypothetical protein